MVLTAALSGKDEEVKIGLPIKRISLLKWKTPCFCRLIDKYAMKMLFQKKPKHIRDQQSGVAEKY
jgi:hypothetical protein